MELVTVMRSQGAQTLILSPSGPLPLQTWVSPENPFSSSEVFPEESLTCQKAAWGVGDLPHLPPKCPGWLEPVLISWGVRGGRKHHGFRKLLGFFTLPAKGLVTPTPWLHAEQSGPPLTEHLLNARPWALLGRMGVWEDQEGAVLRWLSPMGNARQTYKKFADTGFPYQSRTNNSGNAKRLHVINC